MSILIKGMTAEELLDVFQWARTGANNCMIGNGVIATELPYHGDLIDRDALMEHKGSAYDIDGHELYAVGTGTILRMPVVIPAERSEESICDNCDYRSDAGCSWCRRFERSEDDSRESELISICSQKGVAWDDEVFYNELHKKQETK